jgi:hypothetical protein
MADSLSPILPLLLNVDETAKLPAARKSRRPERAERDEHAHHRPDDASPQANAVIGRMEVSMTLGRFLVLGGIGAFVTGVSVLFGLGPAALVVSATLI